MKYKATVRYDNGPVEYKEETIDFDGSLEELLAHGHIVSAEEVKSKKQEKEDTEEESEGEVKEVKKNNKKSK